MKLYDKTKIDKNNMMYDTRALLALAIPVIIEQLLSSLMGTVDTMMVSNVSEEALSAVSLVDSINVLVFQVFAALATGGTIICSQYIGFGDNAKANKTARQVVIAVITISMLLTGICCIFRYPILNLIYGDVDAVVMNDSAVYFFITALSFPFLALFNAGSAFCRAAGDSKFPMRVSVISNGINIIGNAILIFVFHMGVAGAAYATLLSRIFCAVVVFWGLRKPDNVIVINNYREFEVDWKLILVILSVGIPSGIENGMFQFGKLAIQSSVATLGTTSMAAQAMTNILELVNSVGAIGVGIAMMTVVGQAIGAGRKEEAKYYIVKMTIIAEIVLVASCILVFAITKPVTILANMTPESAALCFEMTCYITIVKPVIWIFSFLISYGIRAAGDIKFSMIVSVCTMWLCRVALATYLIRVVGIGILGVWIGMFADWFIRGIIFSIRFISGKWLDKKVIE